MTAQRMVQESVSPQHRCPDADQNHPADEVRQIHDGLNDPLHAHIEDAIEQQCESDGGWEVEENLQAVNDERIQKGVADRGVAEQRCEIVESDPRTIEEAEIRRVILKGNNVAEQW